MKTRNLIAIAGAALLLVACIPSINPFYTDKDMINDPHLAGEWQEKANTNNPFTWTFEATTNHAYNLTVAEHGKIGKFSAHLFQLKQERFLDLIPTDCDYAATQDEMVAYAMFPGHLLVRVGGIDPELKLAGCDYDWLQKFLVRNPNAIAHHVEDDRIVLTGETKDLQKFVLKHLGTNELFQDYGVMTRRTKP